MRLFVKLTITAQLVEKPLKTVVFGKLTPFFHTQMFLFDIVDKSIIK